MTFSLRSFCRERLGALDIVDPLRGDCLMSKGATGPAWTSKSYHAVGRQCRELHNRSQQKIVQLRQANFWEYEL